VQTKPGARTITLDPQTHTLYLPTAETQTAAGATRPTMKPDSFQILVIAAIATLNATTMSSQCRQW
jgi:hypothetical protein